MCATLSRTAKFSSPCVTYRPMADGTLAVASIETREPLRFVSDYEPETQSFHFAVLCKQETGETYRIGSARSRIHADHMIRAHMLAHPEHYGATVESL